MSDEIQRVLVVLFRIAKVEVGAARAEAPPQDGCPCGHDEEGTPNGCLNRAKDIPKPSHVPPGRPSSDGRDRSMPPALRGLEWTRFRAHRVPSKPGPVTGSRA